MTQIYYHSNNAELISHWVDALGSEHDLKGFDSESALLEALLDSQSVIVLLDFSQHSDELILEKMAWLSESRQHRFMVLTTTPKAQEGLQFLSKGARGYGNAMSHSQKLMLAIQVMQQGDVWLGSSLAEPLSSASFSSDENRVIAKDSAKIIRSLDSKFGLTDRESGVLDELIQGLSNQQIGEKLHISERTVKGHLSAIYRKTNTRNRVELSYLINQLAGNQV